MLPKKGKMFHLWVGLAKSPKDYAELIGDALKEEHGDTHRSVKTIMRWTNASERSVKNWLSGESGPSGYFLMRLFAKSAAVQALVLELITDASARKWPLGLILEPMIDRAQRSKPALIMVTLLVTLLVTFMVTSMSP